jgi:hypothetical protein
MSGLDKFLFDALSGDGEFRGLFWNEVLKTPAASRRRIEASLAGFPS